MPFESREYKQHDLLPSSHGGRWTVLIRRPREALFYPEVAEADDYQHAMWLARRIVDRICTEPTPQRHPTTASVPGESFSA